jgi:hypothetical protein
MARDRITTYKFCQCVRWYRVFIAIALVLGLGLLSGTPISDGLRAASYFVRTRKGPAVSMLRMDQASFFGGNLTVPMQD